LELHEKEAQSQYRLNPAISEVAGYRTFSDIKRVSFLNSTQENLCMNGLSVLSAVDQSY
jgi:hypothetical protein